MPISDQRTVAKGRRQTAVALSISVLSHCLASDVRQLAGGKQQSRATKIPYFRSDDHRGEPQKTRRLPFKAVYELLGSALICTCMYLTLTLRTEQQG